jgi:hypothetical protein
MGTLTTVTGRFFLLPALIFLGGGIALAYDLPGIPASGSPVFGNDVIVQSALDQLVETGFIQAVVLDDGRSAYGLCGDSELSGEGPMPEAMN